MVGGGERDLELLKLLLPLVGKTQPRRMRATGTASEGQVVRGLSHRGRRPLSRSGRPLGLFGFCVCFNFFLITFFKKTDFSQSSEGYKKPFQNSNTIKTKITSAEKAKLLLVV